MKCPNCGAEIRSGKTCEFCGSRIPYDMQLEQEKLNKKGCPKCGSTNIRFAREQREEITEGSSRQVIYETVGICNDCGYTWHPEVDPSVEPPKKRTWLWVLGWIFIFPLPLTMLLLRKKDIVPALRYAAIAAAWIIYLVIVFGGFGGCSDRDRRNAGGSAVIEDQSGSAETPGSGGSSSGQKEDQTAEDPSGEQDPSTDEPAEDPADGIVPDDGAAGQPDDGDPDVPGPSDESHVDTDGDGISDDLKAFLDSFEEFVDYYCDFMKTYNSTDTAQAEQYTELLMRYNDFMKKASAWDTFDMNEKEYDYYMATMARISGKLLEMALTLD